MNRQDGLHTYFEDWGGGGPPVLVYTGLGDSIRDAQENPLVLALESSHRMVFADHRGHGRSDKPHASSAYALPTRVSDAVAVLDEIGLGRAHVLGFSWGARLGFAIGEHAPDRVASLVLCGNQPYAWDQGWVFVQRLTAAFDATEDGGMQGFVAALERSFGESVEGQMREELLRNDPAALRAAWHSAMSEGAVSADLRAWRLPCLIYLAEGEEMYAAASRAASEIQGAEFIRLSGVTHLSAPLEVDRVLPAVNRLFAESR